MKLQEIVKDPESAMLYAERYINFEEPFKEHAIGGLHRKYTPYDGEMSISLYYFLLEKDKVDILNSQNIRSILKKKFINEEFIHFPVHPQLVEDKHPEVQAIIQESKDYYVREVQPTASMRTFYDEGTHIKTSFPHRISSSNRAITPLDIQRGIWVSNRLNKFIDNNTIPDNIGFLEDSIGFMSKEGFGAIIRDGKSSPEQEKEILIPATSLFAFDKYKKDDELLIEQLAKKEDMKVEEYTLFLINEQMNNFFWMLNKAGILSGPHGQNMLIGFNENLEYSRLIHRDFQGRRIISSVLEKEGTKLPNHHIEKEKTLSDAQHASLAYDLAIGKIFYDRAFSALTRRGYNNKELVEGTKDIFHSYASNSEVKFHPNAIMYTFVNDKRRVVDTKARPKYR